MDHFDLGAHTKTISTESPEAQRWFDLGLNWCYAFNHEEAIRCFERVLQLDPRCVLAHWGIAYASGPFYNYPWRHFGPAELIERTATCFRHLELARQHAETATPLENALVEAFGRRVPQAEPGTMDDYDRWDEAYCDAMREVHQAYPEDHDVMALLVEALIVRTPWRLWDVWTGLPAEGAHTVEALAVCERSLDLSDRRGTAPHPAVLHLHIHVLEMSNTPEEALRSADELATMCPDAGHLNHMPSHIYVLCGMWEKARQVSVRAIAADDKYLDYAGPFNFYTTDRCHDLHLMMYAAMFLGHYADAIAAAEKMCDTLSPEVLRVDSLPQLAATMEGYYSMKMHVLTRFGRWDDIVAEPLPDDADLYCVSLAMHHYAKAIAHAALGDPDAADHHRAAFHESVERIPSTRKFFNNSAHSILAVGEMMMEGEVAYHRGEHERAFACLREAVRRDDNLAYTEPWAWMHPPRHALAALLAEQGHFDEAERHYRADLGLDESLQRCARHPNNVWSLHGLVECLRRRGATDEVESFEAQLAAAQALADTPITSSCMCRTKAAP